MPKNKVIRGFTIIELIVVIAVISFLAAIVLANVNGFMAKARDARRIANLDQIAKALIMYYERYGNYVESGSGCGYNGGGSGWFNYVGGTSYPKSVMQCLIDSNVVSSEIIDPTKGSTSTPTSGYTYMKYHCAQSGQVRVYIYAKLETIPQSSTATDGTCCPTCDSSYGMNYWIKL